jgi:phage terminase large subunit-like protein
MPHSISRFTDKVLTESILIEQNRLTQVCAANAIIKTDAQGNQMFDKARGRGRMDGMVSMAMAIGASAASDDDMNMTDFLNSDIISG